MSMNPRRGELPGGEEHQLDDALEQTDVLPPTTMVDGKYRLGRLLGEGGMGAVYEAEHTGLGVRVAVKLLNEIYATDQNAVARFRREARAAAAIRHPNIVEVTDTGTDQGGVPFIVMELLEGESLSALLRRERVLSPGVAAAIVGQILHGLASAHDKGVIHRDLKPGNILLARNQDGSHQVKILDFGISKLLDGNPAHDVTATGSVIGTPRFMAPEQARGQSDIDGRTDIYAIGVLFYRMVTGRLPFAAPTQEEVIRLILQGHPVPPRQLRSDLPPELERIILKCMATNREERFPDVRTLIRDLQEAVPDVLGGTIQITTHTGITAGPTPGTVTGPLARTPMPGLYGDRSTQAASPSALRRQRAQRSWLTLALIGVILVGAGLGGYAFLRKSSGTESGGTHYPGPPFRFGITRYLPEAQVASEHSGLVRYLSERIGRQVELKVYEDYIDLSQQLAAGNLEMAALTSYAYVRAKRQYPGLRILATHITSGGTSYEGYIIAKANSGIETLKDLTGKVFCYIGPNSSSGYLYPRALFRRQGLDPDRTFKASRFTGEHIAALKAVADGACDGAAVFGGILLESKKHGISAQQYAILARTARIPYDAYCVPPTLETKLADRVREALLALGEGSDLGRSVLGENSRITGFAPALDSDYDTVRKIEAFLDQQPPRAQHER